MSSPGGPGNPENGEPWGGRGSWGAQPGQQGGPPYQGGMRYQGFGTFDRPQEPTAPPPVAPLPPPPPPSPPRRNRGPLIALCAAVAVVLVVVVTAVVFGGSGGDDDARAGSAPAPTSAAPETSAATAPGTSAPTSAGPPPEPLEPGWQAVPVPKRNAAYDVPPGWELQSPSSLVGFGETEDDPVTVSGVALYQHGYCPDRSGSFRGLAGATARRGPDAAAIATDMARRFSELAYGADARIELTPPQPAVLPGGLPGHKVVATVFPAPAACGSPSAVVNVLTTDGSGGTAVVHVAAADQEVPDAVTPDVLDRITASVRPAG